MQVAESSQILLTTEEGENCITKAKAAEAGGFQLIILVLLYS